MKIRSLLFVASLIIAVSVRADFHGERQPLWPSLEKMPDYQEHQMGAMTDEFTIRNPATNKNEKDPAFKLDEHRMPYIEWYGKPANFNGAVMILVSGGSYQNCCDVGLVRRLWPERLSKEGYLCVNFVYRTPRSKIGAYYQTAWQDAQRAVRLVRSQAKARGFDSEKIGVIGMSAGGHLVTLMAVNSQTPAYAKVDELDDLPCHINWCVANAPAYNTETAGEKGIARKEDGTTLTELKPHSAFRFNAKTCPISFHHGGTDPYTPNGSTQCYRELRKRGIPAELHLYADKSHGAHGLERAVEFLTQMEFAKPLSREIAIDHRWMPGWTIRTEKELLWPVGRMPNGPSKARNENQPGSDYEPYLVWFIPEKPVTRAVQVIVPGGGYGFCNFNGEGTPVAHYLNQKGMTAVVVMYRCPRPPKDQPKHLYGWQDAQRAIRMVKAEATARGLDPERVGLMGFSAGGHLTLMVSTNGETPAYEPVDEIDRQDVKLAWACPIYPAYSLTDGADVPNVKGGNYDDAVPVPEFAFDRLTPPMCFVHGDADLWASMNSVKIWEKLRSMGIQSDLHTLAKRGHCFQIRSSPGTGSWSWLDQVWDFLGRKGFNK